MHQGFEPGTEVGGFFAGDVVGAGGAGVVQRAWDPTVGRAVALKVLDGSGWDPAVRERFEREVRMGGGLTHPNIVPVLDAGELDGRPWIAMQFIEGPTLAAILARDGRLAYPRMVKIASDIAAALDFAHGRGIVHRDVKPGNILVMEGSGAGGADHAYLADFGITRAMADAELAGGAATVLGTPAYIAPEQRAGGVIDGRADVYALACVIFEMLTGAPPFGRAPEPGHHVMPSLLAVRQDVSPAADLALRSALAQDPDLRPATAGQLVAALATQPVAPTVPLAPMPQSAWTGPEIWQGPATMAIPTTTTTGNVAPRRRRGGALAALFVGVFAVTTLGLFAVMGLRGEPGTAVASPGPGATTDPEPTRTPRPTRNRTPAPTQPPVDPGGGWSREEQRLLAFIPAAVQGAGCWRHDLREDLYTVRGQTAAIECNDPTGTTTELLFYRVPDLGDLRSNWAERMRDERIPIDHLGCWVRSYGETSHNRGRVSCNERQDKRRVLRWTDERDRVYGYMLGWQAGETKWTALVEAWNKTILNGRTGAGLTDIENELRRTVPAEVRGRCYPFRYQPGVRGVAIDPDGDIAALDCWPQGVDELFYFLFDDVYRLETWFAKRPAEQDPGYEIPDQEGCVNGEPGRWESERGPMYCYYQNGPRLRWWDRSTLIYGGVNGNGGSITDLLGWWRGNA